ncbi:MAG: hypothetical protein HKO79_11370 [Desulfobacterales bacterium]|nr:hypothetical protein [Deltaproteobacteria bacterium]NNL43080.1 hypothetical protein [Desulfobacterales bacterium]
MSSLKKHISKCIDIDQISLNEISINDIWFEENTLIYIREAVMKMLEEYYPFDPDINRMMCYDTGVPCKGFWVENTKDLVLHFTIEKHFETLIINKDDWMVRDDITIN